MKPYYFPVHLLLVKKRKKEHNNGPYLGRAFTVPRGTQKGVRVRLYRPAGEELSVLPVLFNVHGGGWLFGDAEGLDLQSQYVSNHLHCFVVNVDYRLADERPFPYQQYELADTVEFFLNHAAQFRLDPEKAAVMGYSAGGHIAAGAAILLRDRGIKLTAQVLCYPFLNHIGFDYAAYTGIKGTAAKIFNRFSRSVLFEKMPMENTLLSPAAAEPEALRGLAPAVIVTCGRGDTLLPQGEIYAQKLEAAGVKAVYRVYDNAYHGFMEHGFPDDPAVFEKEGEQDTLMRQAVDFVKEQNIFGD